VLRNATAKISKNAGSSTAGGRPADSGSEDPWASQSPASAWGAPTEEPPF
jgi:hypothetical protein